MSALSGKRVACLTKDVLQQMQNDTSFRSFYDVHVVLMKSKSYPSMSGPMLSRRTRAPRRIKIAPGEPTYPVTAQVLLKDGDYFCFDDIIVKLKSYPTQNRK